MVKLENKAKCRVVLSWERADGGMLVGRATQDTKSWHVLVLKSGWNHIGVYLIILYNPNIYAHHFVYMKNNMMESHLMHF